MATRQKERVEVGRDAFGKPIHKWASGNTTKELHDSIVALYIEHGLVDDLARQIVPIPVIETPAKARCLFQPYVGKWMKVFKAPTLKPTTYSGYKSMLRAHLYPAFGMRYMDEITAEIIQEFLNERSHLAHKTLKELMNLLGLIFADAMDDGVLEKNPAKSRKIVIPSTKKAEREALPLDVVREILAQLPLLDAQDRRMMSLLLLTGMRRGEVLGLRWEDMDADSGLIHVQQNVTYAKNQPHIGTPKTKKGFRDIPLDARLWTLLQPMQTSGFVIGGEKPLSMMAYKRAWERIGKIINLHEATAHVFRHTYLTIASNAGVSIKTLQAIGGHADISTTMNRYVHTQVDQIKDAGVKISQQIHAPM